MQITNDEAIKAKMALDKLCQERIPVATSMKLAKMAIKLDETVNAFAKVRQGLFTQYKIKQERKDGDVVLTSEGGQEALAQFAKEFDELLNLSTELVVQKVKLPDNLVVEPATLIGLQKFVEL